MRYVIFFIAPTYVITYVACHHATCTRTWMRFMRCVRVMDLHTKRTHYVRVRIRYDIQCHHVRARDQAALMRCSPLRACAYVRMRSQCGTCSGTYGTYLHAYVRCDDYTVTCTLARVL
jgi:hypothetical protein